MNEKKVYVAMSHNLTNEQLNNLKEMGYNKIIISQKYKELGINNIDPEMDIEKINELAIELIKEIIENSPNAIIVLGEYSLVHIIWCWAEKFGLKILLPTTKREVEETVDENGNIIKRSVFKHIQFREIT